MFTSWPLTSARSLAIKNKRFPNMSFIFFLFNFLNREPKMLNCEGKWLTFRGSNVINFSHQKVKIFFFFFGGGFSLNALTCVDFILCWLLFSKFGVKMFRSFKKTLKKVQYIMMTYSTCLFMFHNYEVALVINMTCISKLWLNPSHNYD